MMKKILSADYVLTPEGLKENWSVVIENGIICDLGATESFDLDEFEEKFSFENKMLMPGFINGHNHMYGFLSHGIHVESIVEDFNDFLKDYWWPMIENRIDHTEIEATTEMACLEMIDSGVTSFVDVLEAPMAKSGVLELEKKIVEKCGLRGRLSIEACERINTENGIKWLSENAEFIKSCRESNSLVDGMMSIHTLFTCSGEFVKTAKAIAVNEKAMLHMHLSESDYEPAWCKVHREMLPVKIYEKLNYLDENILASQVVQATDAELEILARKKTNVVSMPLSNCEVGGGFAPISKMLDLGMNVGLGTDGYVNSFFEVMRGAFLMHKGNQKDPMIMPAKQVYDMATSIGAEAIGKPLAGKLETGCYADIISVSVDLPTPLTENNVYDQIVLFMNKEDVKDVIVAGKWLKRDGDLLTIDRTEVKKRMRSVAADFWNIGKEG